MTQDQAARIQHELLPGSGCVLNGEPFLTYGIWVLPFMHGQIGLTVFLIDRPIALEADHQEAKREAAEKFGQALARKDTT
jgi:hypothetical protein